MGLTDEIMTSDQLRSADIVRQKRGLPAINPNKIEGFGELDPPAPTYDNPYPPLAVEAVDDQARHIPSPLIPQEIRQPQVQQPQQELQVSYCGVPVTLSSEGQKQVIRLVLSERMAEIQRVLEMIDVPAISPPPAAEPRKKMGRPKGSKNKPKEASRAVGNASETVGPV